MRLAAYVAAARNTAPFVLAAVGLLVLVLACTFFVNSEGFGYDYLAYDGAARRIAAGEPLYLPRTAEAYAAGRYEGLYLYPAPVAVGLLPLTLLDERTAIVAWMVARVAMLVGACLILPVSWRTRMATVGVAGLSFPVLFDLNIGNVSIVILALCAVAWRWIDTPAAAVAHAAMAMIRFPFLIFGLLLLVQRRFAALGWTIAAGIAFLAISIPIVGVDAYAEYFAILRELPGISVGEHNLSFQATALALGLPGSIATVALAAGFVVGLGAMVFAGRRRDRSTAFVVTATATLLAAPFIHSHYLVILLLPAAWLVDRGRWWALAIPLLAWLPDSVLPFTGLVAIGLVLATSAEPKPQSAQVA